MSVRFSNKLVAELFQPFWAALQAGEFFTDAAVIAHTHRHRGLAWLREAGGVRPRRGRDLQGRYLAFGERKEIALGLARSEPMRQIAARLGRSVSTISREVTRNRDGQGRYRPAPRRCRPMSGPAGRNRRSWRSMVPCGSGWSRIWARSTPQNIPRVGYAPTSLISRRCGCPPRRSTSS